MGERLPTNPIRRIGEFAPWWIKCRDCGDLAVMSPDWGKRSCECKCKNCGALYKIPINRNYARQVVDLPLWLKASFRENVLWAVKGEHLDYLEQVVGAILRERPILNGKRESFTTSTPFNLPSWILSAKNRPGLLRLIKKPRKTIPGEMLKGK